MLSRNNVSSEEWTLHPLAVQRIWEIFGRARVDFFASKDTLTAQSLFYKEHRCPGLRMAQPSALCFPPSRSATVGTQASQGTMAQADSNSPPLEEPTAGVRVIPAAESSPMADLLETGSPLSSEWYNEAPSLRSEISNFLDLVSRPRLRPGHLRCVSGTFISAGDVG